MNASEQVSVPRPENPPNVPRPSGSSCFTLLSKQSVSPGYKMVVNSLGTWISRSLDAIRTHALCVPVQQACHGLPRPKKVRFEDGSNADNAIDVDTPEYQVHKEPGARGACVVLPPEGSSAAVAERAVTYNLSGEGANLLRSDYEGTVSQRRLYFGGYRSQECIRHSTAANASIKTSALTNSTTAWAVDIHREFRVELSLLTWSHWDREDALGFRPVRKSPFGATHGRFEVVLARPARWDSLRRHIAASVLATGVNPLIGLGIAFNNECETWQYYDPCWYKEDIYLELILRGGDPALRSRNYGCPLSEDPDITHNHEDVCGGERNDGSGSRDEPAATRSGTPSEPELVDVGLGLPATQL